MRMSLKQLKHLSVETASGTPLGHIHDLIFEIDGQLIAQYLVKPSIVGAELTVGRDQVLSITETKMLVDDNVKKIKIKEVKIKKTISPNPILAREEN